MTGPQLFLFWRYGSLVCRISLTTEPAPYWVVVYDGNAGVQQRSFPTHDEATQYAIEQLRRVTDPKTSEVAIPNVR
jgi:hypothetical protein